MLAKFKYGLLALFIGLFSLVYTAPANAQVNLSNPKAVVTSAIDNTLSILSKYKNNHSTSNTALRNEVVQNVLPYFNTDYISGSMLGPFYRTVSADQRESFKGAVVNYMVNAYIEGLSFYKGQKVKISDAQIQGKYFASVNVTIYDRSPINVNFKLVKDPRTNQYGIIDFVAEGISFADTKAQEWRQMLQSKGINYLTNYINSHSHHILNGIKPN